MESLVEVEDFPGRLLHVSALWDNADLLEDLLRGEEKQCLNARDSWGRTALHAAATNANSKCLRILLKHGASVDVVCGVRGEGRTSLHIAAEHGHYENVSILIEFNANLTVRDHLGLTPLDLAEKGDHKECMKVLQEAATQQEEARLATVRCLQEACVSGDLPTIKTVVGNTDNNMIPSIVNHSANGSNTLLFKASEHGHRDVVQFLLENGSDGRIHSVTKYSPLYIAAYNGHKEIVEILVKKFPELIQVLTVEKWSPLHAACINGHTLIFEYLLKFPFRKDLLKTRKDKTGHWEYNLAFDINQCDVTGQTLLYLATCVNSIKIIDLLLTFKVKARKAAMPSKTEKGRSRDDTGEQVLQQQKRRSGIQALISKLRGGDNGEPLSEDESWLNPILLDIYCNNGTETSLHNAVRRQELVIATKLLAAGANPNLIIYANENCPQPLEEQFFFKGSSCLVEACKNRDISMLEILLKYSARDDDSKALYVAVQAKDDIIISKLLSLKANQDLENEINRKGIADVNHAFAKGFASVGSLAYSSIFPSTSVMINWHNQGCLSVLKDQYLVDAAVRLNPKLKLSPKFQGSAIHAITRLDLSNNELIDIPDSIWSLQSLKILNLAQNKIEVLPAAVHRKIGLSALRSTKSCLYNCPMLEEIYLQDNRLQTLPVSLFILKSLTTLDVSNNKLQYLPFEMWTSPCIKELNLSFNLLSELPCSRNILENSQGNSYRDSLSDVSYDSDLSENTLDLVDSETESKFNSLSAIREENLHRLALNHNNLWSVQLDIQEKASITEKEANDNQSLLASLNLAHNSFSVVPKCLACLAPNLVRLNLSYNLLSTVGAVMIYPKQIKHLDFSYNQINVWPGDSSSNSADNLCYEESKPSTANEATPSIPENKKFSRIHKLSGKLNTCPHKTHSRLESLRTLILSNNNLTYINFYCQEKDRDSFQPDEEDDKGHQYKSKILFPALSMLDVSNNEIQTVPPTINDLANLSVLNLSGNTKITDLPSQMGLLYKLWNLNTKGCSLQEPLLTMSTSKSYKTSDIIGYLRSILENSKTYARLKLMIVGIQGIGKTSLLELLRQEGGSFKRKQPAEHWAKRMGNKNINMRTGKGVSISTVGVDIGDWTFERKAERHKPSHGPVVFRTWDFGGQTEYYSTHQYFLSKRSLYVVVWKITDGERGMNEIQQWLINIQARAPNSPVIIVGTHLDLARDEYPPDFSQHLQQKIREKFIMIGDPEKCGLPKVLDTIEVSCKSKHNIKLLANLLYDTAFSLKSPGSKTRLLEQKIPASYLALEDLISMIASDLKNKGHDPVVNQEQYEEIVNFELEKKFGLQFRDTSELNQATKFLHENGLLLHYDDATLKDLYFLDPQWLCDILSHVVTIREINPFAKNGIMRLDDLKHVFKSSASISLTAKSYIVNLLNKFEVALTWDSRTLLIPSLLPTELLMRSGIPGMDMRVKIAVRTRGWGFRGRRIGMVTTGTSGAGEKMSQRSRSVPSRQLLKDKGAISRPVLLSQNDSESTADHGSGKNAAKTSEYEMTRRSEVEHCIYRLLLMSYFPSGFWSRLLTRILADDSVVEIVRSYFIIPEEMSQDPILVKIFIEQKPEWVCWQTGLELRYMDATLFSMKQVLSRLITSFDYQNLSLVLNQEDTWAEIDTKQSSILEVILPQDTVVIKRPVKEKKREVPIGYQAIVLDPNPKSVCQLLALAVEHIDTLLEDWYPSLGTRFLHTSEGRMLVTRIVPCPRCLALHSEKEPKTQPWQDWSFLPEQPKVPVPENFLRVSQESNTSDKDSGVGAESPQEPSRLAQIAIKEEGSEDDEAVDNSKVYSFMIEECILNAFEGTNPVCPSHGELILGQIAPDSVFLDLDERLRISSEHIKLGDLIGRGAFGFVYESICRHRGTNVPRNVAVKMLQPIDPGPNARHSTLGAFKANKSKWERDPLQYACKAYCTARQELNILIHLKHPHIVPLVGICSNPLSIVLELAPMGALDQMLKHYRRSGDKLSPKCIQLVILQIAKALEYLHQHRIIYRDLKSENVLVWQFPDPFSNLISVQTKLADYGISRPTLPSGAKGFGGTEGFMAPEIVKYNGEEEYTEKVDSFSFGMFIYELLTLHQPFVGYESVKELILEGGRPPLSYRELMYPTYILDLMVVCWSHQPRDRPSSSQLVSIASAPEFIHLVDVATLEPGTCFASVVTPAIKEKPTIELWMAISSTFHDNPQLHAMEVNESGWQDHMTMKTSLNHNVTSMCLVNDVIWIGDNLGHIHAYSCTTYNKLFTYKMEPDNLEADSPVRSIHFLPEIQRACVAMHNGRMFLCCADVIPSSEEGCEGTFLITELGSSSCIHSVTSLKLGPKVEIWCGESRGAISVFSLTDGIVTSQEMINHNEHINENAEVLQVITDMSLSDRESAPLIWTFIYPGCYIYQWQAKPNQKAIRNKLDCSKLVPSSESLKTIAIDEHFSPGRCQIASMIIQNRKLYVGTSWGCMIVADAVSMRPMSVFRPFAEEIQAMIAITDHNQKKDQDIPLLVAIGKSYRNLIGRFVANKALAKNEDGDYETERSISALLWKPDDWLLD